MSFWDCLDPGIRPLVQAAAQGLGAPLEEIRLRAGQPVHLLGGGREGFVTAAGTLTPDPTRGRPVAAAEVARTFQAACQGSVYAWAEELRGGFLTLPGGHRVGVAGRAVVQGGRLETLRPVASLSIRVARSVPGAAAPLWPLVRAGDQVRSTLILSPPQAGKTTVLRDLVRLCSGPGRLKVAVVDERSEVAGCATGVPQLDVGPRTDVLDGCPKAVGLGLAIRSLSPQVVAVDELGGEADAQAVLDALHAGVAVLATAHAGDLDQAAGRPALAPLLAARAFVRVAVLSRRLGPATLEQVWDLTGPAPRPLLAAPVAPSGAGQAAPRPGEAVRTGPAAAAG